MKSRNIVSCNTLTFEPNMIPDLKYNGRNIWSSDAVSKQRLSDALWPRTVDAVKKNILINQLSDKVRIISNNERLGNLLLQSIIHRFITIITNSCKLYIDNTNLKPLTKFILSFGLSTLPALFLIYVVGYPATDLLINSLVWQVSSVALSYVSLRTGNFLRESELISNTKDLSLFKYGANILTSFGLDLISSVIWRGKQIYAPTPDEGIYNVLKFCVNQNLEVKDPHLHYAIYISQPLLKIADKLIWSAGRMALDLTIVGLKLFGVIKDIRSPFVTIQENDSLAKEISDGLKQVSKRKRVRKVKNQLEETVVAEENTKVLPETSAAMTSEEITNKNERQQTPSLLPCKPENETHEIKLRTGPKVKTRPDYVQPASKAEKEERLEPVLQLTAGNYSFYRLYGDQIPDNSWGVIAKEKAKELNDPIFERSLASGHIGNSRSALKYLKHNNEFSIRPRSKGDRILGSLYTGMTGLQQLFDIGLAATVYDQFKAAGEGEEPQFIIYSQRVKHSEISKSK